MRFFSSDNVTHCRLEVRSWTHVMISPSSSLVKIFGLPRGREGVSLFVGVFFTLWAIVGEHLKISPRSELGSSIKLGTALVSRSSLIRSVGPQSSSVGSETSHRFRRSRNFSGQALMLANKRTRSLARLREIIMSAAVTYENGRLFSHFIF